MSFDAVVVALALISASAIAIGLLIRQHSAYRESVADALARGDIAKEEVEALKRQLEEMNKAWSPVRVAKRVSRQRLL